MMKRLIVATLWLVFSAATHSDDMSVSDFLANKMRPTTIEYVAGMGEGMQSLNYYRAQKLGADPVFCIPPNLKLNAGNFMNIVEVEIVRNPQKNVGLMPLVSVMTDGLIRTFPCK